MKKSLFFVAAASALMLTACSSENDVVQSAPQTQETAAKALDFDVYMPGAVTRAGNTGVMTTQKLKDFDGFGVFAMYQNNVDYSSALAPNFMFNEHVSWSGGWSYSPLKYWPNETIQDSQSATTPGTYTDADNYTCDKLSFFAYAPYVDLSAGTGLMTTDRTTPTKVGAYTGSSAETSGILSYTKEGRANDPLVEWKANTTNLDEQVDLLWGVAPNGMAYQSVNPDIYINKTFGLPLLDMVKPDKDQKIKFLFQHALSRIGLSVVSSIDQVAAGDDGAVYTNAQTRVLIKSVEIYGDFGKQGVLNLNNTVANKANWIAESIDKSEVGGEKLFEITTTNGNMNADLRYIAAQISAVQGDASKFAAINTGVLPSEQPLFAQGADPSKIATDLTYSFNKALYTLSGTDYVRATTTATAAADVFTKDASGNYTQFAKTADGAITLNGTTEYFTLAETTTVTNSGLDDGDDTNDSRGLTASTEYYVKAGTLTDGNVIYTKKTATGTEGNGDYITVITETPVAGNNYTGTCYTELLPRYFMVIPTGSTPIKVKITYAVVTKDEKLTKKLSDVENDVTKEISVNLESGKSYNLKLILGLTSVKLDASVADWQVGDETEYYLPKNNE